MKKWITWASSKLKISAQERLSGERKAKPQTGRQYLQITYLMNRLYSEYVETNQTTQ